MTHDSAAQNRDDVISAWLAYLARVRRCAESTLDLYRTTVLDFFSYIGPTGADGKIAPPPTKQPLRVVREAADITPSHVIAFAKHLHYSRGVSVRTIASRLGVLRRFFAFLEQAGEMATNPASGLRASKLLASPPARHTLTGEQIESLLAQVAGDTWLKVRNRAILHVLLDTGVLVAELVELRISDLSTDGTLRVANAHAARELTLTPAALDAVEDWLGVREVRGEPDGTYFFITRQKRGQISMRQVQNIVKRAARAAGMEDVSAGSLRQTFARRLYEQGATRTEVRRLLGVAHYVDKSTLGIVEEDTGPNRCVECGAEVERRSTRCRSCAVKNNWGTPGFRERWLKARYGR